jgi:DNA-binding transcriptional MerR regulator
MAKSPDAFRTISEVSEWLDTPAHVLRFWESKFTQIKPVKRAGGRRYYRPEDMALLGGIKTLLHEQGMTIKGVQKLLRERGIRHVAGLGPQPLADDDAVIDTPDVPTPVPDTPPLRIIRATPQTPPLPVPAAIPPAIAHPPENRPDAPAPIDIPAHDTADTAEIAAPPPPVTQPAPPAQMALPIITEPPPRSRRALPDLPPDAPSGPGILSAILARDPAALARKATRLAPAVQRLAALRDHLRATL